MNLFKKKPTLPPPAQFKDLEVGFKDLDGHTYHRFPANIQFPLERHAKRADIASWMSAGLTSTELKSLVGVAITELENLVAGKKGSLVRASAAMNQILVRDNMVIHHELMYQWIAVHYVREDENLFSVSDNIMDEKIESFKKMVAGGQLLDFFQLPELKNICNTIGLSSEEFLQSWSESMTQMRIMNQKLKYLTSEQKSQQKKKTPTAV